MDNQFEQAVINPTGIPNQAGIIQEVYVENFMCHRKLSIKFCRNVNLIQGHGSSKSAISTAIQECLGGGLQTHRDLVRKENGAYCSSAKVRVTLSNKGVDGYKHDVYGDTITVERVIALHSGGGYKLLDYNMNEHSRAKKDVHALLDQFNIKVENPLAIFDRVVAKKFTMGTSRDRYEFFNTNFEERYREDYEKNDAQNLDSTYERKRRRKRKMQCRYHLEAMTNICFEEVLHKMGGAGELQFDHDEGELDLSVQKDGQMMDVEALSESEQSFAILSLFFALGETSETPFRVMDDSDAFLDPVARKIDMVNFVNAGMSMEHRQFIFITPIDLSKVKTGPKLRIFPVCRSLVSICKTSVLTSLAEANVDAGDFLDNHMNALIYGHTENNAEFKHSCFKSFCRIDFKKSLRNEVFLTKLVEFTKDPLRAALWGEMLVEHSNSILRGGGSNRL